MKSEGQLWLVESSKKVENYYSTTKMKSKVNFSGFHKERESFDTVLHPTHNLTQKFPFERIILLNIKLRKKMIIL